MGNKRRISKASSSFPLNLSRKEEEPSSDQRRMRVESVQSPSWMICAARPSEFECRLRRKTPEKLSVTARWPRQTNEGGEEGNVVLVLGAFSSNRCFQQRQENEKKNLIEVDASSSPRPNYYVVRRVKFRLGG